MLPLTEHARFEMKRRGISEQEVEAVLEKPGQKIKLVGGREIWQNKIHTEGREYVLRVVLEVKPEPLVVTVYRTSKVDKYWREEP